jgi:hypothetical protein
MSCFHKGQPTNSQQTSSPTAKAGRLMTQQA